ncbi:MAG: beta-phosphoglucomutase [Bacilli bacterium]|jgi:beta-phosphoglucomutase
MIEAIIFDLDGVLIHTDHYHYLAWKKLADDESIYFDQEINNRLRGVSRMESLDIILEKASKVYSEYEKLVLATKKNEIYRESLKTLTPSNLDATIKAFLLTLKSKNIKIAIGSSSKNAKMILTQIGIIDLFDAISDGTNITYSKPHPEVFLKASEMLGVSVDKCAVVEDAKAGIDAANAGGFLSIGIGDANKYNQTKIKINELSEILNLFEN